MFFNVVSSLAVLAVNIVPGGSGLIRNGSGYSHAHDGNFVGGTFDMSGYGAGAGVGVGIQVSS